MGVVGRVVLFRVFLLIKKGEGGRGKDEVKGGQGEWWGKGRG